MRKFLLVLLIAAAAFAQAPPTGQFLLRVEVIRAGFTFQNMTAEERTTLAAHGAYLKSLFDEGKLTYAGQAFDPKGLWGVIVVNAPDAAAAAAIMNADPGIKGKVFRGEVIPFRTVFEKTAKP